MFTTRASTTLPLRIAFAAATAGRGMLRAIMSAYKRRQNRIALRDMLHWNNQLLDDIGLTREDLRCALAMSWTSDPSKQLGVMAHERRTNAQADAKQCLPSATVESINVTPSRAWRSRNSEAA